MQEASFYLIPEWFWFLSFLVLAGGYWFLALTVAGLIKPSLLLPERFEPTAKDALRFCFRSFLISAGGLAVLVCLSMVIDPAGSLVVGATLFWAVALVAAGLLEPTWLLPWWLDATREDVATIYGRTLVIGVASVPLTVLHLLL